MPDRKTMRAAYVMLAVESKRRSMDCPPEDRDRLYRAELEARTAARALEAVPCPTTEAP